MMSLVADYGSSDNDSEQEMLEDVQKRLDKAKETTSDDEDSSDQSIEETKISTSQATIKLPSAKHLLESSGVQGVLTNKFKVAEDLKIANLERHVKMVCIVLVSHLF